MSITVNTNTTSLFAQSSLNNTQSSLNQTMMRLSSGMRINSAKDDAAGLAISNNMTGQLSGLNQGIRNANDGISSVQTAGTAMTQITNNLQRIRELAVQSSSGTYNNTDRLAMHTEFSSLRNEIDRVANTTQFNGNNILNGTSASVSIQVGSNNSSNDRISISQADLNVSALTLSANTLSTASGAQSAITAIDAALAKINTAQAQNGASLSRLTTAVSNNTSQVQALTSARSQITDADFAAETANLAKQNVLTQAGAAMLAQANASSQIALKLLG